MTNKFDRVLEKTIDNLHLDNIVFIRSKEHTQQQLFQEMVGRAYTNWAPHNWEWVDFSFDEYFLTHKAAPLLARYLEDSVSPDPTELAITWSEQFKWFDEGMRQRHLTLLVPAASQFLRYLEVQLRAHPKFQSNFDNRSHQASNEVTAHTV